MDPCSRSGAGSAGPSARTERPEVSKRKMSLAGLPFDSIENALSARSPTLTRVRLPQTTYTPNVGLRKVAPICAPMLISLIWSFISFTERRAGGVRRALIQSSLVTPGSIYVTSHNSWQARGSDAHVRSCLPARVTSTANPLRRLGLQAPFRPRKLGCCIKLTTRASINGGGFLLGFAILDSQQSSDETAVWLTCRDGSRVGHTNAVVIGRDDEHHDYKVWSLTAGRAVVLTAGTTPPLAFQHTLSLDAFDGLVRETSDHQKSIAAAVADYARRGKNPNLVIPTFAKAPQLAMDSRDQPAYRALSVANYVASVWAAWLGADEQRLRRSVDPRTGETPWIMPEELGSTVLAEFPQGFAQLVHAEPVTKCLIT